MEKISIFRDTSTLFYACYTWWQTNIISFFYNHIIITIDKAQISYRAIMEELRKSKLISNTTIVVDKGFSPFPELSYGTYYINDEDIGTVGYTIEEDKITLFKRKYLTYIDNDKLWKYFQNITSKWNSPTIIIKFFILDNEIWNPIFRTPRILSDPTPNMKCVIDDIDLFLISERKYEEQGFAYRKGYLLYGAPNTGKTTIIEHIASKYNMSVYMIYFNSKNMTDALLIRMINDIPENSLIVFEEIDKQIKAIDNKRLSIAGLLSALDGPQRLPHGTIIIMTANMKDFLPDHSDQLFRSGRIDSIFQL